MGTSPLFLCSSIRDYHPWYFSHAIASGKDKTKYHGSGEVRSFCDFPKKTLQLLPIFKLHVEPSPALLPPNPIIKVCSIDRKPKAAIQELLEINL